MECPGLASWASLVRIRVHGYVRPYLRLYVVASWVLMFIFQYFFESQENCGVGVRALPALSPCFLPDVLLNSGLNFCSGLNFMNSGS